MISKYLHLVILATAIAGCRSSILDDPELAIRYAVEHRSHVTLTLENSYNTSIARLVDADQEVGYYSVPVDMSGLQEGVYFYTLECRGINDTYYFKTSRRMLLLK